MASSRWTIEQEKMYILDALLDRGELLAHMFGADLANRQFLDLLEKNASLDDVDELLSLAKRLEAGALVRYFPNHSVRYIEEVLSDTIRRLEYRRRKSVSLTEVATQSPARYIQSSLFK